VGSSQGKCRALRAANLRVNCRATIKVALGNNLSPERNQALANRQQYWDKWGKENQGKLSNFKADRSKD
jgi:hypothetical protein